MGSPPDGLLRTPYDLLERGGKDPTAADRLEGIFGTPPWPNGFESQLVSLSSTKHTRAFLEHSQQNKGCSRIKLHRKGGGCEVEITSDVVKEKE